MAEKLFKGKKDSYQHSVKEHFKESRLGKDTYKWMKVFRIIPEFRILRLTFHRSQTQNAELGRF